jgi:hypothetical protein
VRVFRAFSLSLFLPSFLPSFLSFFFFLSIIVHARLLNRVGLF